MTLDPVAITEALIRCPSVTPKEAGALECVENFLKPLGFTAHRHAFGEGAEQVENLFITCGEGSPHFCFAGHVDVVPPGDVSLWASDPFTPEIRDGRLFGRGAEDMKGAIGAFIAAVSRLGAFKGRISLLLTCDEEGPAQYGTRQMLPWMHENGLIPDVCLIGEPTNPSFIGEMAKPGRRGSINSTLTVFGTQGHVAYPERAENPIPALLAILSELKRTTLDDGAEFFPPSNLEITSVDVGNPATNVIPASARAMFNIRFNTKHTGEKLEKWIDSVCHTHAPGKYELKARISGEPFLSTPGPFASLVMDAVREVTGHAPELSTSGGTSDARFIHHYCPLIEFGSTGATSHMVNESVKVSDLVLLAECYEEMLRRYFALKS